MLREKVGLSESNWTSRLQICPGETVGSGWTSQRTSFHQKRFKTRLWWRQEKNVIWDLFGCYSRTNDYRVMVVAHWRNTCLVIRRSQVWITSTRRCCPFFRIYVLRNVFPESPRWRCCDRLMSPLFKVQHTIHCSILIGAAWKDETGELVLTN